MNRDTVRNVVRNLEWTGRREGPGFGPHGSGPGKLYPSCPWCGGLKEANGDFVATAVGHRSDCLLSILLKEDYP